MELVCRLYQDSLTRLFTSIGGTPRRANSITGRNANKLNDAGGPVHERFHDAGQASPALANEIPQVLIDRPGGNNFALMRMVQVFLYERFDPAARQWVSSKRYATERAIYDVGGVAIRSTAIEVGTGHLDEDGFLWATPLDIAS